MNTSNWQPIETAPKDGTRILAHGLGTVTTLKQAVPMTQVIFWYWEDDAPEFVEAGEGLYRKVYKRKFEMWAPFPETFTPLHWQPLPPPP